ncbi:hypothetical protein Sps_03239 [Shewanella psychrophila]|uniref:Lipoprotein n=1 Tax=Shewanella psychrophila TaxID=225848 RepID=A0A1S6HS99_9GAMM|nr:hypothetical protein [Shewanella psychrophila]AQS38381.1 hypothetical protein Sps_03239 [Shewanella psychrophila]
MGFRKLVLLGLLFSSLTACTQSPEWTLFYYADTTEIPQGAAQSENISGYYAEVEQCLMKGAGMVKVSGSGKGRYQCGLQCVTTKGKALSCKEFIDKVAF